MVVEEKEDVLTRTEGMGKIIYRNKWKVAMERSMFISRLNCPLAWDLNRIVLTHALRWGNNRCITLQGDEGTYRKPERPMTILSTYSLQSNGSRSGTLRGRNVYCWFCLLW
jgi:hypothetical protein